MATSTKLSVARLLMLAAIIAIVVEEGTSNLSVVAMLCIAVASWFVGNAAREGARTPVLLPPTDAHEPRQVAG